MGGILFRISTAEMVHRKLSLGCHGKHDLNLFRIHGFYFFSAKSVYFCTPGVGGILFRISTAETVHRILSLRCHGKQDLNIFPIHGFYFFSAKSVYFWTPGMGVVPYRSKLLSGFDPGTSRRRNFLVDCCFSLSVVLGSNPCHAIFFKKYFF